MSRRPPAEKMVAPTVGQTARRRILVHFDEITLKGRNRLPFERRLAQNIRRALRHLDGVRVDRESSRIIVSCPEGPMLDPCLAELPRIFGISRFALTERVEARLEAIEEWVDRRLGADETTKPVSAPAHFAVRCHRVDKSLPFDSGTCERRIGARVVAATGWPVRLRNPDLTLRIRLLPDGAYLSLREHHGAGGLPSGSTGRAVILLSGGIDSPVAAWQVLRRGVHPSFLHFHSVPRTSPASIDKVRELARSVLPPGLRCRLHLIPFAELQERIVEQCPERYRVLLYRRFMLRVGSALALQEGARALVTGDNLSQVASQTLPNLAAVEAASQLPVLRPLIGAHKGEIIDQARKLGTYELSIEPHADCCELFLPQHPATSSTPFTLAKAEESLDCEEEAAKLIAQMTTELVSRGEP